MKRILPLLLLALLALPMMARAETEAYTFPHAGLRLTLPEGGTLVLADELDAHAEQLESLGTSAKVVRADFAANSILFEWIAPSGAQVTLAVVSSDLADVSAMSDAERDDFAAAHAGILGVEGAWSSEWLAFDFTRQAGGAVVCFARRVTVRQGALYTITAVGSSSLTVEDFRSAAEAIQSRLTFLGAYTPSDEMLRYIPDSVPDDGVVVPISLPGFDGLVLEDYTTLPIKTLPGARVTVVTSGGVLRGTADGSGRCWITVSTKRKAVYEYMLVAELDGRETSELPIRVERKLTGDALLAYYRGYAKNIQTVYDSLAANPAAHAGVSVTLRGRVTDFAEMNGFPLALIYTHNVSKGVWHDPVWVRLGEAETLEIGDIRTVYGDVRGDTFPRQPDIGDVWDLPVIEAVLVLE